MLEVKLMGLIAFTFIKNQAFLFCAFSEKTIKAFP